jgi:ATP-dependent helicase STH1/SNF2
MRSQGVSETDPEFLKLRNALKAITHMQKIQKEKAKVVADNKARQAGQNGTAPDTHGAKPSDAPMTNGTANGTESAAQAGGDASSEAPKPSSSLFSQRHMMLFKMQIAAFKMLSKNLPLNQQMQSGLFGKSQETPASSSPAVSAPQSTTATAPAAASAEPNKPKNPLEKYNSYVDPYYALPDMAYSELGKARDVTPTAIPLGIDVSRLLEDRDIILYNRLEARRRELANLHANIASWNSRSSELQAEDWSIKRKLLIEFKKLNLLEKQRKLRTTISREIINADNLAMTANRSHYRRIKKQNVREARMAEKLEKQQREFRENKERKKHRDFLADVIRHAQDMHRAQQSHKGKSHKLGRMMLQQHQILEKEEQKRIERTAKQRLQALKANDEETYLKLLGQAKDTRISHLLSQTDGFLKQLTSSVKALQRSAAQQYRDRSMSESESEDESEEDGGARVDYYEVAHRIKEEVHIQSSNLVGGTLKEYQVKGLQWMISLFNNNLNGILADEMGLGKTIQTISLVTYLIEKKREMGPFLIIVPLSTLTNWNSEFEKWAPSVKRIVYKGPPTARKQQQQQIRWGQFQVLLTTYEFIIKDRPILSKVKWLHMIVDEGHRMKNAKSKLSSTITEYYNTRYRLILTGTPLQNNLPELWALLNFVLPNIFKSVKSFDEWFNTPFANTGGQDRMELSEEEQLLIIRRLHKVLRPFLLRRLKKDVEKDLPDKTERVVKCNFSSLQAKLYKQLATDQKLMVSDGKGGKTGMRGLSNMLMQLRKVCNHPFVYEQIEDQINPGRGTNDLIWRTAGKFELLDRILPKFHVTGHRVLMFFQMTQIMNIMEDFMRYRGLSYLRLDGSTKADERSELLKEFNAPNSPYFCFLLSTRAGGLGLNLQTADTVVIFDSDWNPHQDLQAQDRAHRIGQKNEVRILRLITSNSVEEKILERANFKLDMDGKVIQAGKFDNKSTEKEREAMLRIMLESAEAAENLDQDEMDDEDLNLIMMRSDEELEIFTKMDEDRAKNGKYGPSRKYPRLMSESELPDIYVNEDVPPETDLMEENFGRGARERTRVRYDDGLTEEQWLEAVDNSDDNLEDAIARKDARVARRAANKDKRGRSDQELSPVPSRESSASPVPKKRGRKPKAEKRKIEEVEPEIGATPETGPRKRGRQAMPKVMETLSSDERSALQKILNSVYEKLIDLEEESSDDEMAARSVISLFKELPDRTDYPDYYMLIQNPIAMAQIKRKINRREYQSLREFRSDIKLLCDNCRTYNDDESILFSDANLIEQTALDKLRDETMDYPDWQDYDAEDSSGNNGTSTGPVSSVGTPLASGMRQTR